MVRAPSVGEQGALRVLTREVWLPPRAPEDPLQLQGELLALHIAFFEVLGRLGIAVQRMHWERSSRSPWWRIYYLHTQSDLPCGRIQSETYIPDSSSFSIFGTFCDGLDREGTSTLR